MTAPQYGGHSVNPLWLSYMQRHCFRLKERLMVQHQHCSIHRMARAPVPPTANASTCTRVCRVPVSHFGPTPDRTDCNQRFHNDDTFFSCYSPYDIATAAAHDIEWKRTQMNKLCLIRWTGQQLQLLSSRLFRERHRGVGHVHSELSTSALFVVSTFRFRKWSSEVYGTTARARGSASVTYRTVSCRFVLYSTRGGVPLVGSHRPLPQ